MLVRIVSHPPLGADTVVDGPATFYVWIFLASAAKSLEVQLWHNLKAKTHWEALPLQRSARNKIPSVFGPRRNANKVIWFCGTLDSTKSNTINSTSVTSFTYRFRNNPNEGWKWANAEQGTGDGRLLYQHPSVLIRSQAHVSSCFDGLSKSIKFERVASDAPETILWDGTAPVPQAAGECPGAASHALGKPVDCLRWYSMVQHKRPWMGPRHGFPDSFFEEQALMCSFLRSDGTHAVVLAISGINNVTSMLERDNDDSSKLCIRVRNDDEKEQSARILISLGKTFDTALAAVMYRARKIVPDLPSNACREELRHPSKAATSGDIKTQWIQTWYDTLGYNTWNSLGQNLSEEKIRGALEALARDGINVGTLCIDDNWQDLDHPGLHQIGRGLKDFNANPTAFPSGLRSAISRFTSILPSIYNVTVWHAMLGYWGGISPDGRLAKAYKTREVKAAGQKLLVVDEPDVHKFYSDFYEDLVESSVRSVKTDVQFMASLFDHPFDRRTLTPAYHDAWSSAHLRKLYAHTTSCMSQTPYNVFKLLIPFSQPTIVARNSDDFFPNVPDAHPWHIFCNAHNSLLTSYLNVIPDWDMFQTGDETWGEFHAAARCVSSSPISITDKPGEWSLPVVKAISARLPNVQKHLVTLRPSVIGRSRNVYTSYHENRLVKIGSYEGLAETGSSLLGLFNCKNMDLAEIVPLSDFMGTEPSPGSDTPREYVIWSFNHRRMSVPIDQNRSPLVAVELDAYDWDILSAVPCISVDQSVVPGAARIANFGLVDKMAGAVAIVSTEVGTAGHRMSIKTKLKALGKLGVFISFLHALDFEKDILALINGYGIPPEFVNKDLDQNVLLMDLEMAWNSFHQHIEWSNEVEVEILLRAHA